MLTLEWANRGINLWAIDSGTVAVSAGTATYNLPADTIDLLEHVLRTGSGTTQQDQDLMRISVSTYAQISNKNTQARPSQIYINRQRSQPTFTLWPVPNQSYTLVYWRMRRIQDSGGATFEPEIPARFIPAFVAGLAYSIAMKDPELSDRVDRLEMAYEKQFRFATEEDRDRSSWRMIPYVPRT